MAVVMSAPYGAAATRLWTPADMTGVTGLEYFDATQGLVTDTSTTPASVNKWTSLRPGGGTASTANLESSSNRPTVGTFNGQQTVQFDGNLQHLILDKTNLPRGAVDMFWFFASKVLDTRSGDFYPWGYGSGGKTSSSYKLTQGGNPVEDMGNDGYVIQYSPILSTGISFIDEFYTASTTTSSAAYNGQTSRATYVTSRNLNPDAGSGVAAIGNWPEYGGYTKQHMLRLGWGYGNPTAADLSRLQGWMSWNTGDNGGSLPTGHPYKSAAPTV